MNNTKKEVSKIEALCKFLECSEDDLEEHNDTFEYGNREYLVLTDAEADEKAGEAIRESAWAFNYSFLCGHSKAIAEIPQKDYEAMAGKLCESFNKAVLAMIDDVDHFIQDAIGADGRGHFLSSYDGNEEDQDGYYIYRTN